MKLNVIALFVIIRDLQSGGGRDSELVIVSIILCTSFS